MRQRSLHIVVILLAATLVVMSAYAGTPASYRSKTFPSKIIADINAQFAPAKGGMLLSVQQTVFPSTVVQVSSDAITRVLNEFYPGGRVQSTLVQRMKNGAWSDSLRTTFTLDTEGRQLTEYAEHWQLGGFRPLSRSTCTYNASGDVIISLWEKENGWVLSPSSRMVYTYASPGKEQTALYQLWSAGWTDNSRWSSTWDAEGRKIGEIGEQWSRGTWDTTNLTVTSYVTGEFIEEYHHSYVPHGGGDSSTAYLRSDAAGNILVMDQTMWTNGIADFRERITNTYDSEGHAIASVKEELVQGVLTQTERESRTLDGSGNEMERLHEDYSGGVWSNSWRFRSAYDVYGNISTCAVEAWKSGAWTPADATSWQNIWSYLQIADVAGNYAGFRGFASLTFSYSGVATDVPGDGVNTPNAYALMRNFPNPFNPSTTIRYAMPERARVTLTVFNALGEQVAVLQDGEQGPGYHEVQFNAAGSPSGVYFCRMQAAGFVQTSTLLLLK
jgi:hypothetical protein